MNKKLPYSTLILMISFASVNAVLFTPALPDIAAFFNISSNQAQHTITWFLIAYALGQLIYGPLTNRFGRKITLYIGICLQIISSLICVYAGIIHEFLILILGRFLLALGSGVGLKMAFTLVNEAYEPKIASQKISYVMLSFAITPGLAIALGGILNTHFGWMSCFYACALYGLILLFLTFRLPTFQETLDREAFKISHLIYAYKIPFQKIQFIARSLLMGLGTSFIYVFAALTPFIAIDLLGMTSQQYGLANILPPIGLIAGSLTSSQLAKRFPLELIIRIGIIISFIGTLMMLIAISLHSHVLLSIFIPTMIIYFGLCLILANTSSLAMNQVTDKAHGSAVMNFINMGTATILVLLLGIFPIHELLLPITYLALCVVMFMIRPKLNAFKNSVTI